MKGKQDEINFNRILYLLNEEIFASGKIVIEIVIFSLT